MVSSILQRICSIRCLHTRERISHLLGKIRSSKIILDTITTLNHTHQVMNNITLAIEVIEKIISPIYSTGEGVVTFALFSAAAVYIVKKLA